MRKAARKARKRAQGGRPRREGVPRYENGAIDYRAIERQDRAQATVIDARMRLWGLNEDEAKTPTAGTAFGRMFLQGEVTAEQHEAGREFDRRRAAYLAAIVAPRSPRSGSDLGYMREPLSDADKLDGQAPKLRVHDEAYVERCALARRRYADIRRAILDADGFGLFAMEMVISEDKEPKDERTVGSLRVALNAVARLLKIERGS